MTVSIGSEVKFRHLITKEIMTSKVYDIDSEQDPSNVRVLVKIGEGALAYRLLNDCEELP
jgi:hypothetical protein